MLTTEDFTFKVNLPCPHDGREVREWLLSNSIQFWYNTSAAGSYIKYAFTSQEDAVMFLLRWS